MKNLFSNATTYYVLGFVFYYQVEYLAHILNGIVLYCYCTGTKLVDIDTTIVDVGQNVVPHPRFTTLPNRFRKCLKFLAIENITVTVCSYAIHRRPHSLLSGHC